jgi:hypothetical protein
MVRSCPAAAAETPNSSATSTRTGDSAITPALRGEKTENEERGDWSGHRANETDRRLSAGWHRVLDR